MNAESSMDGDHFLRNRTDKYAIFICYYRKFHGRFSYSCQSIWYQCSLTIAELSYIRDISIGLVSLFLPFHELDSVQMDFARESICPWKGKKKRKQLEFWWIFIPIFEVVLKVVRWWVKQISLNLGFTCSIHSFTSSYHHPPPGIRAAFMRAAIVQCTTYRKGQGRQLLAVSMLLDHLDFELNYRWAYEPISISFLLACLLLDALLIGQLVGVDALWSFDHIIIERLSPFPDLEILYHHWAFELILLWL